LTTIVPEVRLPHVFGRLNLMRDGAQVDGVVLESTFKHSRITGPGELSLPARIYQLKLQVQFEDGTTTEVELKLKDDDYGGHLVNEDGSPFPSEGDIVPMRYDPKDRSRVEIDIAAIKAKRQEDFAKEAAQVDRLTDLQAAKKRGEISDEEFTREAERELGL
jgi:hypothetical protein